MSDKPEARPCPKCGETIPADAPQGLCPKCLLKQAALPTETGKGSSTKSIPPTQEELAAAFPQLEILELIGQGGMGFVFKARQRKIERLVALKILPQTLAVDPAFAERFTREGRVLARLNHPNIVMIHDFGQANGFFYLLMEFVDGVNLREAMKVGRFTADQALAVVPKICEALQFAHDEGILHRDIKPENILLDSRDRIKIADFGIAKLVGEPHGETNLTVGGATLGTPHYMAPEQLEKPGQVDHRADIYSLGVVFYEMLTGELPLGKFQPPSHKVKVDVRLDEVVLQALEKEPNRRYQHVSEVKSQVDTINATTKIMAAAAPTAVPAPPPKDRFWRRFVIVVSLVLLGLILVPIGAIFLAIAIPAFKRDKQFPAVLAGQREARIVDKESTNAAGATKNNGARFILDNISWATTERDGRIRWRWKGLLPPKHLARVFFIRWQNGVPEIEPAYSGYFKVGEKAADVDFLLSYDTPSTNSTQRFAQWNVSLGLGFTTSKGAFEGEPPFRATEIPDRVSVDSEHQVAIPLLEYIAPAGVENRRPSGVELRIVLQPYNEKPMRTLPSEKDLETFVGGTGLIGTMDEALALLRKVPTEPGTPAFVENKSKTVITLLAVENHSTNGFQMWKPDGSPVDERVRSVLTNYWPKSSPGIRWYSVLVSNPPGTALEEFWRGKIEARTGRGQISPFASRMESVPELGGLLIRFADFGLSGSPSLKLRFAVVERPAQTFLAWEGAPLKLVENNWPNAQEIDDLDISPFAPKRLNDFDPVKGYVTTTNAGSFIGVKLPITPKPLNYWILEVTDQQGKTHLNRTGAVQSSVDESTEYTLFEVPVLPADIRSLRLKGHFSEDDYHWAEFKNVQLKPAFLDTTNATPGN